MTPATEVPACNTLPPPKDVQADATRLFNDEVPLAPAEEAAYKAALADATTETRDEIETSIDDITRKMLDHYATNPRRVTVAGRDAQIVRPGDHEFWIAPFVAKGGITMLHGKSSIGKSPLTWEMAWAVGGDEPFLGHFDTKCGQVLYIDIDTPESLIRSRLSVRPAPGYLDFLFLYETGLDILNDAHPGTKRLRQAENENAYDFVILNTLRKAHNEDMNDGNTPSRFYHALKTFFPGAAWVVVHHDKKGLDGAEGQDPDEAFSGNLAWKNDALVSLHLRPTPGNRKSWLRLDHSKSQVAAHGEYYELLLDEDGSHIRLRAGEIEARVVAAFQATNPNHSWMARVNEASVALSDRYGDGYKPTSVRKYLKTAGIEPPSPV